MVHDGVSKSKQIEKGWDVGKDEGSYPSLSFIIRRKEGRTKMGELYK